MGIWNLSKGEIFFSGEIFLFQNYIKEYWNGKYTLDSLDSFVSQFKEQNKGKSYCNQDRYILWTCYKSQTNYKEQIIGKLLKDIPDNFSPQQDAPDFFDFFHGKIFTIKNNSIQVYSNTEIINDDFVSILNAAKKILHSIYFKETTIDSTLAEIRLCPESIDVTDITNDNSPTIQDIKPTKQEKEASALSFRILFDLELRSKLSLKDNKNFNSISPGIHKIQDFDAILQYLIDANFHPGDIYLDKKNRFYFITPKDPHEQDLIYAESIMEGLAQAGLTKSCEDTILLWMFMFTEMTPAKINEFANKTLTEFDQAKAIRDYILKYGSDGVVTKKSLMGQLKAAINGNPLDFVDDKNDFIANYAKIIISGDAI